jgi:hypothetical protein
MHPLVNDFSSFKDSEIENKIGELTRKYFMTHNVEIRGQIVMILESYKEEAGNRRRVALEKLMENRDKSLDKLINVS